MLLERFYYNIRRKYILKYKKKNNTIEVPVKKYAGSMMLTEKDGNGYISDCIKSGKAFVAARIGENELGTFFVNRYEPYRFHMKKSRLWNICNCAGFFPKEQKKMRMFCGVMEDAFYEIDIMMNFYWKNEEYIVKKHVKPLCCMPSAVALPLDLPNESWTSLLKGKKVLIIHPFEETIRSQYQNRDKLFPNTNILPEFELLTLKAVQTVAGGKDERFQDWFEALEWMKQEVEKKEFDIALLGCGAYGLPLAAHIKRWGKQAIYVGGVLQLLFGIMGSRWENNVLVRQYVNEFWVRPSSLEKPKEAEKVEQGCYW